MTSKDQKPPEGCMEKENIDVGQITKNLDPEEDSFLTQNSETPEEKQILRQFQMEMNRDKAKHQREMEKEARLDQREREKGARFDQRVKLVVIETGPTLIAGLIIIFIATMNVINVSPFVDATDEQRENASSQLGLLLTGTLGFIFGKSMDSGKKD